MIFIPVRVHLDASDLPEDRPQAEARAQKEVFYAWLRAAPDAIELSTGARSTTIPNSCLARASVTRALIDPRLNINLNAPVSVHRHGETARLRLHARPWYRRELQRYADEINARVYDRRRLGG